MTNPINMDSPKPNQLPTAARPEDTPSESAQTRVGRHFPQAIRRGREILIPSGGILLVFERPMDAHAYSEILHRTHFVGQTTEPWRPDEVDGVKRVWLGTPRLRRDPDGRLVDMDDYRSRLG